MFLLLFGFSSFLRASSLPITSETLFEGDMLLGKGHVESGSASSALADPYRKWTGGTIYYRFHSNFSSSEPVEKICQAFVGRKGGPQNMFLHSDCFTRVTLIHELMHAMGFVHEHTRSDRDQFITIFDENIDEESKTNFKIYDRTALLTQIMETGYAYDSVMHYKENDFSANGKPTMKAKNGHKLGPPANEISKIDKYRINLLYGCLPDSETSPAVLKLTTPNSIVPIVTVDTECSKPVIVKEYDTCWSIAVSNNMALSDFIKLNSKIDCNRIYPGIRLCLEKGGKSTAATVNCGKWHIAAAGEYCDLIMSHHDIVPEEFYKLNPGFNCDNLNVGNKICVAFAGASTVPPTTPSSANGPQKSSDCFNINQCCSFWAEDGRCTTQKSFMNEHCKFSCGLCSPSNYDPSIDCSNRHPSCKTWADVGECERNPFYMLENCRYECKECWREKSSLCETSVPKTLSEEQAWLMTSHNFVWAWGCRFSTQNGQVVRKTQVKECVARCAAQSCDHFSWNPSHQGTCTLQTGISNYKSPDCATADFVCGFKANKVQGYNKVNCV